MTVRYFITLNNTGAAEALARIPDNGAAQRVNKDHPEWQTRPSLLHLISELDMNWSEVDRAGAEAALADLGLPASILDDPLTVWTP